MSKEPVRLLGDHLKSNPRRKLGPQKATLTQCAKHGQFFPRDEQCCWCEPPVRTFRTMGERYFDHWWANGCFGLVSDTWEELSAEEQLKWNRDAMKVIDDTLRQRLPAPDWAMMYP